MSALSRKFCAAIVAAFAVVLLGVAPRVSGGARQALAAEAPASRPSAPIVTESVVYSFCSDPDRSTGACLDGETPNAVVEGSDGNFYGTTGWQGANGGTIFQFNPSGTLTTLHTFCPNMEPDQLKCLDGWGPDGLIEGSDGNFYGTASSGGSHADHGGGAAGTLYMITPSGTLTTLYAFCAVMDPSTENCLDGEIPDGVIQGTDGNFYGTTYQGGPYAFGGARPAGTVYMMTPAGVLTTLYSFCAEQDLSAGTCLDGEEPVGLFEGSDGNFYGFTLVGGPYGTLIIAGGTVFKITPSGTLTTLYSFCKEEDPVTSNCIDGDGPSGLIEGSDGNLYGTTFSGGADGEGTVFKLTPAGTLTTLYSFCSRGNPNTNDCPDGKAPEDGVIEGSDGNFYGTTRAGGEFSNENGGYSGTAFKITPSGTFDTLYSFCSELDPTTLDCLDGATPNAALIQGSDGNFYGVTANGGGNGDFGEGTLFKLAVSFPTTVESSLTISPGGHSFGKTKVGHMHQATFTVRSHGKEANEVVLGGFTIIGVGFSVDQTMTTCEQGQMLQSNQNCKIVWISCLR